MKRGSIVVFASGSGTTFKSILDHSLLEESSFSVKALVTNKMDCGAVSIARGSGLDVIHYPSHHESFLKNDEPDLIVLAGFLKILQEDFVNRYGKKIINTHPSLLPSFGGKGFYGMRVHEEVKKSGAGISGFTVHMVDSSIDSGTIIAQYPVPILPSDTPEDIAHRVHILELENFPLVIDSMIRYGFRIEEDSVSIDYA